MWRIALAFLLFAPAAAAQDDPAVIARRIESRVWSPYCPGRLLSDCTTAQAAELRVSIERRLRSGQTERQVVDWLRDNYGDEVLAQPLGRGSGLAIWLVPAASLLAAGVLVAGMVRRWSRAPLAQPVDTPPEDDPGEEWIRRVREEVEGNT